MKTKVKNVVETLVAVLREWDGVQAVVLQHFAEKEVFDPNFSVTLDVFRDGDIPDRDERQAAFPGAMYYDSSRMNKKDRFMLEDLPVRISYKDCSRVDAVLAETNGDLWLSMERGTYLFHRIATGTEQFSRGDWLSGVLKKLDNLPEVFWTSWSESCQRRLDHFLSDMGAATIKDDALYFRLSLSSFLRVVAELIFAVNHVFEPGPRDYTSSLALLETLPAGFGANWESLLREDSELPADRKREVAELLARSVFSLRP